MHLIGVRKSLVRDNPSLPRVIYEGFVASRDAAIERLRKIWLGNANRLSLPWLNASMERTLATLGTDYWSYGYSANKAELDAKFAVIRSNSSWQSVVFHPKNFSTIPYWRLEMIPELFLAGLEWPIATALIGFSFLGSFITVAFGIGGGGILIAVFATLLPATAIIPVHGLVQLGSNVGRTILTFRHVHWEVVWAFLLGSLIGVGLGSVFVVDLNAAMIQIRGRDVHYLVDPCKASSNYETFKLDNWRNL